MYDDEICFQCSTSIDMILLSVIKISPSIFISEIKSIALCDQFFEITIFAADYPGSRDPKSTLPREIHHTPGLVGWLLVLRQIVSIGT